MPGRRLSGVRRAIERSVIVVRHGSPSKDLTWQPCATMPASEVEGCKKEEKALAGLVLEFYSTNGKAPTLLINAGKFG